MQSYQSLAVANHVRARVDGDLTTKPVVAPSFRPTIAGHSSLSSCVPSSFLLIRFALSELAYIKLHDQLCDGIYTSVLHGFHYLSSLSSELI